MDRAEKEEVQLRAAIDLADRGSKTAKITKLQAEPFKLDDNAAQMLADALVASATARQRHVEAASGNYIKVDVDTAVPEPMKQLPSPVNEQMI